MNASAIKKMSRLVCPLDALHPLYIMSEGLCLSASFNGNTDGLKRHELISNPSAHVFIIIYSSLQVIIRIIKAKRACICIKPPFIHAAYAHMCAQKPPCQSLIKSSESGRKGYKRREGRGGFLSFESSFGIIGSCFVTQL